MTLEREKAELLTGCWFAVHPDNPTLGVLRLDTRGKPQWALVTKDGLLALANKCAEYAEKLQKVQ